MCYATAAGALKQTRLHPCDLGAALEVDVGARLLGVRAARQHHISPNRPPVAMVTLQHHIG